MRREATGHYEVTSTAGESVRAFVPAQLPPEPPVALAGPLQALHERALLACGHGADRQPGEFRRSQNWIGCTRPGNARFVPPPPALVEDCMGLPASAPLNP